jgi:3',5'-cyclic AMP phosphodiesterase CpdA
MAPVVRIPWRLRGQQLAGTAGFTGPDPSRQFKGSRVAGLVRAATLLAIVFTVGCDADATAPPRVNAVLNAERIETIEPGVVILPNTLTSVKFAVIGDSGRWSRPQRELAALMTQVRQQFSFEFVLMLGDNIYEGPATREDYLRKFEEPYAALLEAGVDFYAALGNHDDPGQIHYAPFHMNGERYYSFAPPEDPLAKVASSVEFFALDTTNPDREQLRWLDERLAASRARWKVCFFHHPLYTTGRYQYVSYYYRRLLEPLLARHGVDVVFSGHEHIYQRSHLEQGIQYFVSGAAGSVRAGDGSLSESVVRNYSEDLHFVLAEIDRDAFHFQAMSRTGITIDAGTLSKDEDEATDPLTPEGTLTPERSRPDAP